MSIRIEDAFNDCYERLMSGESLESCLSSYPVYAAELDFMLRTSYDIKRRAYPIQPRPEFKYWARVRMQNVQQYGVQKETAGKPASFNLRRNLAISLAALLVFTIASSGTVAASSDAMPDEPLYGVKLAVEQAQVTLASSEVDKAEAYARLTEKRAQEIAVMAAKGNDEKVISTTKIMNYQLQQIEENLVKYESKTVAFAATTYEKPAASNTKNSTSAGTSAATGAATGAATDENTNTTLTIPAAPATRTLPATPSVTIPMPPPVTANATRKFIPPAAGDTQSINASAQNKLVVERAATIKKARETVNAITSKNVTVMQNALDKAPDSVKLNLSSAINETITTNMRIQTENTANTGTIKHGTQGASSDNTTRQVKPFINPYTKPKVNSNVSDTLKNRPNVNTNK